MDKMLPQATLPFVDASGLGMKRSVSVGHVEVML